MERIVLLARNLALDSAAVTYTAQIARASRTKVECLALVSSGASTAEWLQSRPARAIQRLRRIRGRLTTAEWVQTMQRLRLKERERVKRQKEKLRQHFARQGSEFSCQDVAFNSAAFLKKLEAMMPADLIISETFRFPGELAHQGIMTVADLGAHLHCTAIDADVLQHCIQPVPKKVWGHLLAYGIGSMMLFFVFFPRIEQMNSFFMSGGIVPALTIMGTAAATAWIYGRTVESLLKWTKLDIY